MNTMAPCRPAPAPLVLAPPVVAPQAGPQACRVRLTPGPVAAAQARRQVGLAIAAWNVPVDPDIAVLLTSDLVAYAILRAQGGAVTLSVRRTRTQLRVDVQDSARPLPMPASFQASAQVPPGLALVARLSAGWGLYQTPAGKAAYFTLALEDGA